MTRTLQPVFRSHLRRSARLAAAMLLVMPACGYAQTTCSANDQLRYDFTNQAATALSYATTYNWTATSINGASQSFSLSFTTNGVTSTSVGGQTMPRITNLINDGAPATGNNLMIGGTLAARTTNITGGTNMFRTTITFPTAVREVIIQMNDVDFGTNQFRDWMHVQGFSGATPYTASITTPFSNNNGAGPRTDALSTVQLGASTTPLVVGVNEAVGTAVSGNTVNNGTVFATFAQPVTSVVINYGNSNQSPGGATTGVQAFGLQYIRFCPMPNIVVDKTSAPVIGALGQFNLPGEFVDYTITVTNTGRSTVDANSAIIQDLLPPNVTYFHGDIDPGTAGVQTFVFTPGTSGLTLGSGNVTYTNNNGASYTYTPASGLDANLDGMRFNPQGSMAALSSYNVRFRVRIN